MAIAVDGDAAVCQRREVVILPINVMYFRSPHLRTGTHPCRLVELQREAQVGPRFKVAASPQSSTSTSHVVLLCLCVRHDKRVAEVNVAAQFLRRR